MYSLLILKERFKIRGSEYVKIFLHAPYDYENIWGKFLFVAG